MDPDADPQLYRIRHSLAHVLAQAVLTLRPGSTLGFGPPIDDGFYYDFLLSSPLTEDDFPALEKAMKEIIKKRQPFEREDLSPADAFDRLAQMNEPYKREYAQDLVDRQGVASVSFYRNGPFLDMCEGPHVDNTIQLTKAGFKLRSLAGAYWRGNSDNAMMTRIYAWAFASREELDAHVKQWEEAQARDHKKLGKALDIYVIDDAIGKGLPLWLPNGGVLREELEKLAKEMEFHDGYHRVATPHLSKEDLYYLSGHLPYYAEGMYPPMILTEKRETDGGVVEEVKERYRLKPMNCPHHHRIFASRLRSYRDLPLRFAEYGHCYRFEDSGALSGLLRVRGMCMNDAHIYCTAEQVIPEFVKVMRLYQKLYGILGLEGYYMRLSCWDPDDARGKEKYIDDPAGWERTQQWVRDAMNEAGMPFVEEKGEAAFYGPKIDTQLRAVTGRVETASTNQLDFGIARRMGLTYRGADNGEHHPYIIHRAPLGTHERFCAFLIEHYGGAFPTWLAPVQARVVTVADRFNEHADKLVGELRSRMVRAEVEASSDTVSKKIRNAAAQKIPNVLVVGEREVEEGTVTLRRHGSAAQRTLPFAEFSELLHRSIATRSDAVFT